MIYHIPISSTSHLLMLVSGKTALSAFLEALSGFHAVWAFFGVSCLWAIWPVLGPLWCASSLISWCAPPCICDWQISLPLLVSPVAFWDPWLFILDSKNRSRSQKASERNRDSTCPLVHLLESSLSAAILCSTKKRNIGLGPLGHGYYWCGPFVTFHHVHRSFAPKGQRCRTPTLTLQWMFSWLKLKTSLKCDFDLQDSWGTPRSFGIRWHRSYSPEIFARLWWF